MTTLHAVLAWRGGSRNDCDVLIWGDGSENPRDTAPRAAAVRSSVQTHPSAMGAPEVAAALDAYGRATGTPAPRGAVVEVALHLPTREGRPGPSDAPTGAGGPGAPRERYRAWTVPALRIPYADAIPWLAALPTGAATEELPGLGNDLRYLSRVAKFVYALLLRRKLVPVLVEDRAGRSEARWNAILTTEDELAEGERLRRLTPPSLDAYRPERLPPGPGSMIRALLDAGVDALARRWLSEGPAPPRPELPEGRWVASLGRSAAALPLPRAERAELRRGLVAWTGHRVDAPSRYRVCFRVDPPRPEDEEGTVSLVDAPEEDWRLEACLQARDDPSELIPVREVVADPECLPRPARGTPESVLHTLLGELRRAGRIYPPLARLLAQRVPSTLTVTTAEIYEFLRDGAPLLTECGFGILAPPWWSTRRPPLGARIKLRPSEGAEGYFGLESLLRYDLTLALGDHELTGEELERLARLKVPLIRFRGQWVEVRPEDVTAATRALEQRRNGVLSLREALGAEVEGRLGEVPILGVLPSEELRELWSALRGEVRFREIAPPAELRAELRPYQIRGYSWLSFWSRQGLGACLADDMGLGKTLQCLATLLANREGGSRRAPSLLVCPTSVVENWRREAERFTPTLVVRIHHGEERPRHGPAFAARCRGADLIVTSYALLWRDAELFRSRKWDTVVLDEAQNIKNPLAKASQTAFALLARHRIALTGTPVENRLSELWSIMQFLNPGLLGPLASFESRFATPIERYSDPEAARTLQRLVRPWVLRRLKSDREIVPDLPAKIEIRADCSLTPEQASLYEATVREMMERIERSEGMDRRALVLTTLAKLKQVCDHPALLLRDRSRIAGRSGKLERLEELLEEALSEGDSALVFTQWREMGAMLTRRLAERFGCPVSYFHGALSVPEREQLLGDFRARVGPRILVLTLRAGGSGLNLTEATRVFHYDRWWNPAVESQATDRAYRIGQRRRVLVHKLVVAGTVEERIDALLQKKAGLAESVLTKGEGALTELSTAELRELFALRPERDEGAPAGTPSGNVLEAT